MKNDDKLNFKYAVKSPVLPPEGEEEIVFSIPKHNKLPQIEDLSEQEMKDWEEFIAMKHRKKERMEGYLGEEEKLEQEEGTIPAVPTKKKSNLSPDNLLKMCSKYYNLALKF